MLGRDDRGECALGRDGMGGRVVHFAFFIYFAILAIITTSATGGMHTHRRGYYRLNLSRGTEDLASHYTHCTP